MQDLSDEHKIENIFEKVFQCVKDLSLNHSPIEVAAVLVNMGLTIYKLSLSEEEYHKMVDFISRTRDQINTSEHEGGWLH